MRRTRHVVLPVRSWQYIGLLLVSLACVTFGLVARDREGQAGSLTGPELLHRAPHDVDVCPNLDPFQKLPACLESLEKQNPISKNNERRVIDSGAVRIERKRSVQPATSSTRLPERRLSRSLERIDERIRNSRSVNRKSPSTEVQTYSRRLTRDSTDHTRRLSRTSDERSRSMDRREEREIERRVLENRELRERRERFEIAARRIIGTRNMEKREIRGNERFQDRVRLIREKRDADRERILKRRSNSIERRESRLENRERTQDRRSNSIERRESILENRERNQDRRSISLERCDSRLENRERRLNSERRDIERRNSRLNVLNRERRSTSIRDRTGRMPEVSANERQQESIRLADRRDIGRRNVRSEIRDIRNIRLESGNRREDRQKIEILDRRSRSTDRLDSNSLDRERRLNLERRVSAERRASANRDRRSQSLDRRTISGLDREKRLVLERRISTDRRASENLNRYEDQRLVRRTTDLESYRIIDRRSRSLDRRASNELDRERRLTLERRVSDERKASQNLNRREDQRLVRRTTDFESNRLLDRRSRSFDRRASNELDRERRLGLERRISAEQASNRRENRRELANRLSRSQLTINRDSRGEIERTRSARSSESSDISKERQERRRIFLSRGTLTQRSSDSIDRREIGTLRRAVRSIVLENQNSLRLARRISDRSLTRTTNERTDRTQQKLTRERINDDYRLDRSRVNRDIQHSRQEKRSSRSSEILNRSNLMERRESLENRRARTNNDRRSTVLSTERRETQQRGPIVRTAAVILRTDDLRGRRNSNARIQERLVEKIERNADERSRDQRRNVRLDLTMKRNMERRNSDSRIRYTDSEKGLKMIDRSRDNTDRRFSQRKLVDLRQSDSLRDKIRTSEVSTRMRNTLIVPSIDRDRSYSARDRSLEKNKRLLDLDRRVRKITQDSRDDDYGRKISIISSFLKTNTLSNYDSTFEVLRQAFVISICIVYGLSMSNSKKLFTGNLMERINPFALR